MIDLKHIKIFLLDANHIIINEWKNVFKDFKNIEVVHDNLKNFLNNTQVECIVSPANSFGLMDGGYDYAIAEYYKSKGIDIISIVQDRLWYKYLGEQPVGTSEYFKINDIDLIHTPTMTAPMYIGNTNNVYMCMKSTLLSAMENNIKSIVIPAFGGGCGCVEPKVIAVEMYIAYDKALNRRDKIDLSKWEYVYRELRKQNNFK